MQREIQIPPRIVIEKKKNPLHRAYHFSKSIIGCEGLIRTLDTMSDYSQIENLNKKFLGEIGLDINHKLRNLPGITVITFLKYEINILIGAAFEWNDIEENVLLILKQVYPKESDIEVRSHYLNNSWQNEQLNPIREEEDELPS